MNEFNVEELSDDNLIAVYKLVTMTQDDEILADDIPDDMHRDSLQLVKEIDEEMKQRGLEP